MKLISRQGVVSSAGSARGVLRWFHLHEEGRNRDSGVGGKYRI
jgi:hypothetical protein